MSRRGVDEKCHKIVRGLTPNITRLDGMRREYRLICLKKRLRQRLGGCGEA